MHQSAGAVGRDHDHALVACTELDAKLTGVEPAAVVKAILA